MKIDDILERGRKLFDRQSLLSLWQEIADNFYPERADFTIRRYLGSEFAAGLMTGYPVLVRRDLGNAFSSMLRPSQKPWFSLHTQEADREKGSEAKKWLEAAGVRFKKFMYDRGAQFVRTTKEGDHDFASFGQCVLSVKLNRDRNGLLYQSWHLRDVAWCENSEGKIDTVYRRWKPSAKMLKDEFGEDKLHPEVKKCLGLAGERYKEFNCWHVVMPTEDYDTAGMGKYRTRFVSLYIDVDHKHLIAAEPVGHFEYIIPRWQTVSGSQYAYSPATVVGLADARLIQAMTRVLLEAGEKAVNPPMVATDDVVRSEIAIYAGGVTWVDQEYDERLGEALRPISQDYRGIPVGLDMLQDQRAMIAEAFYINKLGLPPMEKEATAFEIAQRVQEYIRAALPLFEPMEMEYNGALCETSFSLLLANGAFGGPDNLPRALQGADTEFRFESPLHEAHERVKGQRFLEAKQYLAEAVEMDADVAPILDFRIALRDALRGVAVPEEWLRDEKVVEQIATAREQQRQAAAIAEKAMQSAQVAEQAGRADQVAQDVRRGGAA